MIKAGKHQTQAGAETKDLCDVLDGGPRGREIQHGTLLVKIIKGANAAQSKTKVLWFDSESESNSYFSKFQSMGFSETIEVERHGLPAKVFVSTIEKLKIPSSRVYDIFNIPKSTAAHKIKNNGRFEGTEALASIRLAKLLALAESITANSLHPDAKDFDSGKWLGQWIEYPQPALGGVRPADLLDTETGGQRVYEVLAAIESGSYQ